MGLDANAYLDVLRLRFGDFLGDIRLAGKRFAFPLEMSIAKSLIANPCPCRRRTMECTQ